MKTGQDEGGYRDGTNETTRLWDEERQDEEMSGQDKGKTRQGEGMLGQAGMSVSRQGTTRGWKNYEEMMLTATSLWPTS